MPSDEFSVPTPLRSTYRFLLLEGFSRQKESVQGSRSRFQSEKKYLEAWSLIYQLNHTGFRGGLNS